MAGERKGLTYEAIVKFALDELVRRRKLNGNVFWNEKPDGMSIEPDFTVGADKDNPTHVFLVTHSGAAGNSHMKFWRNIGELTEAKVRLPEPPRVYSVAFDAVIKEDLKELQAKAFDGQLLIGDSYYGRRLQRWVEANTQVLPKDGREKVDAIRGLMKDKVGSDNPHDLVEYFVRDLGKLVQTSNVELDTLWHLERSRRHRSPPAARNTFVRRGIAKLLVLPDVVRHAIASGKRTIDEQPGLAPAVRLGVLSKSLSLRGKVITYRIADAETLSALSTLSSEQIRSVLTRPLPVGVQAVIEQVRSVTRLEGMIAGLVANYAQLTRPSEMLRVLERQHADPSYLYCSDGHEQAPDDVWLFRLVCECVKVVGKLKQSYGYAQLVGDIKTFAAEPEMKRFVSTVTKSPKWSLPKSTEPVRRGLQDYVNRIPNTSFSRALLAVVAFVLSTRLADMSKAQLKDSIEALEETWISSAFEARLLTHRSFDPVGWIVADALKGFQWQEQYVKACFAEAIGSSASVLSGTTKIIRVKSTLINWQSAHESHTNDKKKELCGRAPALRYSWDAAKRAFVARRLTEKLILIIDGTWGQGDLEALAQAGWDELFYPDEMDKFAKAVV